MKSKFIDPGLYMEGLKQLRPIGITAGILVFLISVIPSLVYVTQIGPTDSTYFVSVNYGLLPLFAAGMFALVYIVSTVLVHRAFSFLNHRNASDFYHSLPAGRTCLYASLAAAVLTWVSAIAIVSLAAAWILISSFGWVLNPLLLPCVLATTLAACLFTVSAALIAVSVTGTRITGLIANALLLFLPFAILWLMGSVMIHDTPIASTKELGILFQPSLNIPSAVFYSIFDIAGYRPYSNYWGGIFLNPVAIISTAVEGLLYLFLGWVAFTRRKSEAADRPVSGGTVQLVLRCALALPFLFAAFIYLALNTDLLNNNIYNLLYVMGLLILAAAVFYFGFELAVSKKGKKLVQSIPAFFITLGISAALALLPLWIGGAVAGRAPAPEEIAYVRITPSSGAYPFNSEAYTANSVGQARYEDPEAIRQIANALQDNLQYYRTGVYRYQPYIDMEFAIGLKDGRTIYRRIQESSLNIYALFNLPGVRDTYRRSLLQLPADDRIYGIDIDNIRLPQETEKAIWKTFKEEAATLDAVQLARVVNDGSLGVFIDRSLPETETASLDGTVIGHGTASNIGNIHIGGVMGAGSFSAEYSITALTPKTAQFFMDAVREASRVDYGKGMDDIVNASPENAYYYYTVVLYNMQYGGSTEKRNYEMYGSMPSEPNDWDGSESALNAYTQTHTEIDRELFTLLKACSTERPDATKPFAKIMIDSEPVFRQDRNAAPLFIAIPEDKAEALLAVYAKYEAAEEENG
jgi:ABC-2 type transport system permease protein